MPNYCLVLLRCKVADRDGDGIADPDDTNALDVAGLVNMAVCPIPDTDKDGINDEPGQMSNYCRCCYVGVVLYQIQTKMV